MIHIQQRRGEMTQEQLAEKLGVDRSTIAKWETGKATPRLNMLCKLAKILNCSISDLVEDDQTMNEET
ncbi:MAG: helix-turn-helix transcriptional regulator [Clostridia bacterium]|nr:helix-turn-helix transcriptional regulator [Clostridia bacterium]